MGMYALEQLRGMLCREIEEIAKKGELTAGALDTVHKLTDTVKNIDKIGKLENGNGYSQDYSGRYYRDDGYSGGGYSGGRYSRDDYSRGSSYGHYVRGHYSRDDGKRQMTEQLRSMLENADGADRQIIQKALEELERA